MNGLASSYNNGESTKRYQPEIDSIRSLAEVSGRGLEILFVNTLPDRGQDIWIERLKSDAVTLLVVCKPGQVLGVLDPVVNGQRVPEKGHKDKPLCQMRPRDREKDN